MTLLTDEWSIKALSVNTCITPCYNLPKHKNDINYDVILQVTGNPIKNKRMYFPKIVGKVDISKEISKVRYLFNLKMNS